MSITQSHPETDQETDLFVKIHQRPKQNPYEKQDDAVDRITGWAIVGIVATVITGICWAAGYLRTPDQKLEDANQKLTIDLQKATAQLNAEAKRREGFQRCTEAYF